MKLNRKGFTLVELLVAVAILGIITGLSIPLVRNISMHMTNKKYTEYMDSLVYASKLYTDSYSNDLFGYAGRGCTYIDFPSLKNYHLAKDIDMSGVSCDTEYTVVKVVKYREKFFYKAYIGCGNKGNGKVTASIFKPEEEPVTKESLCSSDVGAAMNVFARPAQEVSGTKKQVKPRVTIESYSGVSPKLPPRIKYGYMKASSGFDPKNFNASDISFFENRTDDVLFKIPTLDQQEKTLAKSIDEPLSFTSSNSLPTPNASGEYYLVLQINRLLDSDDISWKKEEDETGNYVVSGPYKVDIDAPTLTNLKVTSSAKDYNSKTVKVEFDVNDNFTENKDLSICISEKECTNADYNKKYKENGYDYIFSGNYDGSVKKVYIGVKDSAGNIATLTSNNYTLYKECTTTKTKGDWKDTTACTKKCGGGTKNQESSVVDTYTNGTCPGKKTQSVACNTMSCCSKTTTTYGGWSGWSGCSKKCGGGTQKRTRSVTVKSAYDGSLCSSTTETGSQACNTMGCCSKTTTSCGSWGSWGSCSKSCGGGTHKRTRTCTKKSSYDGSKCSSYKDTDSGSCNTMGCCSKTTTSCGSYGSCSKKCGGGTKTRTCTRKSAYTGGTCSTYRDSASCNTKSCCSSTKKSSCGSWSGYSRCSGGSQYRTRSCKYVSTINGQSCGSKTEKSFRNCRG